ncbi:MAG: hypothetical protein K1Y02_25705 [Candidatus Hydrogenedentes bacterium]|nr:hypothetical protein [Candidatus Hydrogenedentota bacterium]
MRALNNWELTSDARLVELAGIFASGVQRLRKTELTAGVSALNLAAESAKSAPLGLERSEATALSVITEVNA